MFSFLIYPRTTSPRSGVLHSVLGPPTGIGMTILQTCSQFSSHDYRLRQTEDKRWQNTMEKPSDPSGTWGEAEIKMPGACWLARLAETESPRFSEIPCLNMTEKDTLISTSGLHTNMHTCVHAPAHIHTITWKHIYTHIFTKRERDNWFSGLLHAAPLHNSRFALPGIVPF